MKKILCLTSVLVIASFAANASTIEMKVYGMVCGFCAQGIEASLRKNSSVVDVIVSLERKLVVIETRGTEDIADTELRKAIADAGYDLKAIARTQRTMAAHRAELQRAAQGAD